MLCYLRGRRSTLELIVISGGFMRVLKENFLAIAVSLSLAQLMFAADHALIIGVDVYAQPGIPETRGSTDDAAAMRILLIEKFRFADSSIKVLLNEAATTPNILRELDRIVANSKPGDRVFVHYSGHGFQVPDDKLMPDEKDGLDEVIAPYDVRVVNRPNGNASLTLTKGTYVTDDTFNDYAVNLAGRSVVMMFDSCHSGSISRSMSSSLTKNSRYLRLEQTSRGGGMADRNAYSYIPKDAASRDLTLVKDTNLGDGNLNGAVFISAASPYQEAFPILVEGEKLRGALTYLFESAHAGQTKPNLGNLKTSLLREMKALEKAGRLQQGKNGQFQVPEIEVYSKANILNRPIFGTPIVNEDFKDATKADYSAGLIAALTNQYSTMKVDLSIKWNGKPEENRKKSRSENIFYLNDEIEYVVDISQAGYLYVLVFSANNQAFQVFPAYVHDSPEKPEPRDIVNYLEAGRHTFPRSRERFPSVTANYLTTIQEPYGTDVWVALLSKRPLDIGKQPTYTWSELLSKIGLKDLAAEVWKRTRGVGNKSTTSGPEKMDWQASIVSAETIK